MEREGGREGERERERERERVNGGREQGKWNVDYQKKCVISEYVACVTHTCTQFELYVCKI